MIDLIDLMASIPNTYQVWLAGRDFCWAFVNGGLFPLNQLDVGLNVRIVSLKKRKKTVFVLTEQGRDIGFLISEGYPYGYPRNTDNISPAYPIPEGWSINIYFQDFDVEESKHCL